MIIIQNHHHTGTRFENFYNYWLLKWCRCTIFRLVSMKEKRPPSLPKLTNYKLSRRMV